MNYKSLLTKYKGIATNRGIIPNDEFMYCVVAIIEMGFDMDKNSARDLLECATEYYYTHVIPDREKEDIKSGALSSPDWITAEEHNDDNN